MSEKILNNLINIDEKLEPAELLAEWARTENKSNHAETSLRYFESACSDYIEFQEQFGAEIPDKSSDKLDLDYSVDFSEIGEDSPNTIKIMYTELAIRQIRKTAEQITKDFRELEEPEKYVQRLDNTLSEIADMGYEIEAYQIE